MKIEYSFEGKPHSINVDDDDLKKLFSEYLDLLIDQKSISATAVSKKTNIKYNTLVNLRNGRPSKIGVLEIASLLSKYHNLLIQHPEEKTNQKPETYEELQAKVSMMEKEFSGMEKELIGIKEKMRLYLCF